MVRKKFQLSGLQRFLWYWLLNELLLVTALLNGPFDLSNDLISFFSFPSKLSMFSLSFPPMEKSLSPSQPKLYSKPKNQVVPFSVDARLLELSSHGKLEEAIFILQQSDSVKPRTYISLLQSCSDMGSIELGRKLHSCARLLPDTNCAVETKLVSMYAKCGSLKDARKMFDKMPQRGLITWSIMIGAYVRGQKWNEAVDLFYHMMREGNIGQEISVYVLNYLLCHVELQLNVALCELVDKTN